MRRLIGIAIISAAVLSITASAKAAVDNSWYMNLKASTDSQALRGASYARFGVGSDELEAPVTHGYDPSVAEVTTNGPGPWSERWYIDVNAAGPVPQNPMWWHFRVTPSSLSDTVYLTAWNSSLGSGDLDTGADDVSIYIVVDGMLSTRLYTFNPTQNGEWNSSDGISGNYFQQSFQHTGKPLDFVLVAGAIEDVPIDLVTPEPSSILALFAGVAGVLGAAIRRNH